MKSIQVAFTLFLFLSLNHTLNAQQNADTWETFKGNLFSIRYPKSDWVKRIDSVFGAFFVIETKETYKKPYDRDVFKLRILENDDLLYGDLDAYEAQYKSDLEGTTLSAKRIKKGQLAFYEKVEKNHFGKIKRRIKEHRFFPNG